MGHQPPFLYFPPTSLLRRIKEYKELKDSLAVAEFARDEAVQAREAAQGHLLPFVTDLKIADSSSSS